MSKLLCLSLLILLWGSSLHAQILKRNLPDKLVVLTFDDATASQYQVVAPLLKQYGFGATFFVCEFQPNFGDTSKYMSWQQIAELDRMGFEIANHTRTHAHVNGLSLERMDEELGYIDAKCDSMGIARPVNFAYPGYGLNAKAVEHLDELGYQFARAGGSRPYNPLRDYPLLLPSWATNAENKTVILQAFEQAAPGQVIILTLHGVPDVEHPWVTTPPELFRSYLDYLAAHNFTVLALRDLSRYINVDEAKASLKPDFSLPLKN